MGKKNKGKKVQQSVKQTVAPTKTVLSEAKQNCPFRNKKSTYCKIGAPQTLCIKCRVIN